MQNISPSEDSDIDEVKQQYVQHERELYNPATTENVVPKSKIHLSEDFNKTDYLRICESLFNLGIFVDSNGKKATKKDIFNTFIWAVNADIPNYENLLTAGRKTKNNDKNTQQFVIFDRLKEASMRK